MTTTTLKISSEAYEKLKEVAKEENRSINKMMVHIITKYLANR